MTQTYKVQVSMNNAHIVESGFVWKQGDFGFNIEIEVLDFDTTGATPQIIFRKSTGAVEATEISVAGNKFTYAIRGTELDTPGPCVCDLKLNDSTTKRVSTASFKYFVIPDTMDGLEQEASSYSDTIVKIVSELELDISESKNIKENAIGNLLRNTSPTFESGRWNFKTNRADSSDNFYETYNIPSGTKVIGVRGYAWDAAQTAYGFYDSSDNLISKYNGSGDTLVIKVPVPDNAAKIIVNVGSLKTTRGVYLFDSIFNYTNDLWNTLNSKEERIGTFTKNPNATFNTGMWNVDQAQAIPGGSAKHEVYSIPANTDIIGVIGYQTDRSSPAYAFYDTNDKLISYSYQLSVGATSLMSLTVPANATKLIVNVGGGYATRGVFLFTKLYNETIKAAVNSLRYKGNITSSQPNLNNYTENGIYNLDKSVIVNGPNESLVGNAILLVFHSLDFGNSGFVIQIISSSARSTKPDFYIRMAPTADISSTGWSPWKKMADNDDLTPLVSWKENLANTPLFARFSNGYWAEHPDWVSRHFPVEALCVEGKYLYTGSKHGLRKWDIGIESNPVDITSTLNNEYYDSTYTGEINFWGRGGGDRMPYKMQIHNGYLYMIVRGESGYAGKYPSDLTPNTNIKNETEVSGTTGYLFVLDPTDLSIVKKITYYGSSASAVGYRKPSGFTIDAERNYLWVNCQLYGWILYDISDPSDPQEITSYSPLDEAEISTIDGSDLSAFSGPIEYQNGVFFENDSHLYYVVAGYGDGVHLWDITDNQNPEEIGNVTVTGQYKMLWCNGVNYLNTHVFDLEVKYPYVYCTIAPVTSQASSPNRKSGMIVLNISDPLNVTSKYIPIDQSDWNTYQSIGDVKPSQLLKTNDKIILNNGNKGMAVYQIKDASSPIYRGCIPSDGDEIYKMVKTSDGRLVTGCPIFPFNVRINRGVY